MAEKTNVKTTTKENPRIVAMIGSRVTFWDDEGQEHNYTLTSPTEANLEKGDISILSPVGKALLDKKVGEEVEVAAPRGRYKISIKSISDT